MTLTASDTRCHSPVAISPVHTLSLPSSLLQTTSRSLAVLDHSTHSLAQITLSLRVQNAARLRDRHIQRAASFNKPGSPGCVTSPFSARHFQVLDDLHSASSTPSPLSLSSALRSNTCRNTLRSLCSNEAAILHPFALDELSKAFRRCKPPRIAPSLPPLRPSYFNTRSP